MDNINTTYLVKAVSLNQEYNLFNVNPPDIKMAGVVETSNTMPQESAATTQQYIPDLFQNYNIITTHATQELDYKMLSASLQQKNDCDNIGIVLNNAGLQSTTTDWSDVTNTTTDSVTIPVTSGGITIPVTLHDTKPKVTLPNITNVYHTEGVTIPVTLHTDTKKHPNGSAFSGEFGAVQSAFAIKNEMDSFSDVANAESDLRVHFEQEYQNYTCDFDSLQQDFNISQTAEDENKLFQSNSVEGFPLQVITQEFDGNDSQSLQMMIKKEMYFESGLENGTSENAISKANNLINGINTHKTSIFSNQISSNNQVKPQYECEYCHQVFSKMTCLKVHQRIHVEERPYKCEECSLCFCSLASLCVHNRVHAGDEQGLYRCQYCGKCFAALYNLKSHEKTHIAETPYKCEICDEYFTTSTKLKIHRIIHDEVNAMMAEEAEYRAATAAALAASCHKCAILNQTRAGKDGGLMLKCEDCGGHQLPTIINITPLPMNNGFNTPVTTGYQIQYPQLQQHQQHQEQQQQQQHIQSSSPLPTTPTKMKKPFKCIECEKCFYNQEELDFHVLRHKDSKPFKCDVCGRGFSRKFNLQRHRKVHGPGGIAMENGLENMV